MAKTNSFMCPYCFETIKYEDVEYFCDCERQSLRRQAESETEPANQGKLYDQADAAEDWVCAIKDLKSAQKRSHDRDNTIKCEKCNNKELNESNRRCPNKHCTQHTNDQAGRKVAVPLPKVLFEDYIGKLPFAIIGTSQSGKSVYMHMMLDELKNNNKKLKLNLDAKGFGTLDTHYAMINRMREQHLGLERTKAGGTAVKSSMWLLKNNRNKNQRTNSHFINIFDGAGETHQIIGTGKIGLVEEKEKAYVLESETILFVVDPLTLNRVRALLNREDYESSIGVDSKEQATSDSNASRTTAFNPADIVTAVASAIRDKRRMKDNAIIKDIPIAVVFTKMDLFWDENYQLKKYEGNLFALDNAVKKSPHPESGYFNLTDCEKVHKELYDFVETYGGNFITTVESCFKKYKLFAVSSLGKPPQTPGSVPEDLNPHRVLDPILWLLSEKGIITSGR
ncbi:MAG: hypothetical protein FWH48_00150 [Oscillospiraceae bacterium]|nr:hypothetical protein [Oscillospiraceae bacterium]